jgi:hypothetical protein
MFRFFRKARQAAMDENRMGRFFRYAVGEILLVVIGILIALQINNWNEDRLDRKLEREYMASMANDLRLDIDSIETTTAGNEILLAGLDRLLDLVANEEEGADYERQLFLHSLVYTYWYLTAEFSELTMTQLKSSGSLLLIRDEEVRNAMLMYEQAMDESEYQFDEMKHYFHVQEESQKQLFNTVLSKKAFVFIEENYLNMLEPLENYEPLVPHGVPYLISDSTQLRARYYGDVLFYRTSLNNTSAFLRAQKQQAENLLEMIIASYGVGI